jgi:hypothetical protein
MKMRGSINGENNDNSKTIFCSTQEARVFKV